ncbi:MAG: hypothetical protein ACYTFK_07070, partial [Planctomycetota bacterium]
MVAPENNSICEQARAFYYDYLCGTGQEADLPEIFAHISGCSFCKAEVDRLKVELSKAEGDASIAITNLKLHFAYIGAMVNCETVRPFLPGLADPALQIGVPTPITVHLDKCQRCSEDLERIQQLKLTHKQLCRLGQLFAEKSGAGERQSKILDLPSSVYGILQRAESGITTCFKVDDTTRDSIVSSPGDIYRDW